jgi:hypothetical protein
MPLTDDERDFVKHIQRDKSRLGDDVLSAREIALLLVIARHVKVLASEFNAECRGGRRARSNR